MSLRRTTRTPNFVTTSAVDEWRLEAVMASLLDLSDNQGRLLCPPFRVLESKEEFPVYYEQIKNPIDLKTIAENIYNEKYSSWNAYESDIKLLCKNAKTFNEPGSVIYKDACKLMIHFNTKRDEYSNSIKKLTQKEIARNQDLVSSLLDNNISELGNLSEDSEEDEDSESDSDPKWILYWKIRNYDVIDGFPLCTHFLELPSKKCYPDYYDEIENPVSLYMINKQLKRGDFKTLESLVKLLFQMFSNARSYNIERSEIYKAANKLELLTIETVKELDPTLNLEPNLNNDVLEEKPSTSEKEKTTESIRKKKLGRRPLKRSRKSSESCENDDIYLEDTDSIKPDLDASLDSLNNTIDNDDQSSITSSTKRRINRLPINTKDRRSCRRRDKNAEKLKPGRKSVEELREKFSNQLLEIWKTAKDLKISNRTLCENFMELPSSNDYPDYYKVVKNPIDMSIIFNKIKNQLYNNSGEMHSDFSLMCENAKTYNRPDSQIFSDAVIIQSVIDSKMKAITQNNVLYFPLKRSDKNWTQNSSITNFNITKLEKFKKEKEAFDNSSSVNSNSLNKPLTRTVSYDVVPSTAQQISAITTSKLSNVSQQVPNSQSFVINGSTPVFSLPQTTISNTMPTQPVNGYVPCTSYITSGINGNIYNLSVQQPISSLHQQQLLYPQQRVFHMQNNFASPMINGNLNGHYVPPTNYYIANSATNYYSPVQLNNYPPTLAPQQAQSSQFVPPQIPQKPTEPTFIPTKNSIQVKRVVHSEAYVKYIESLYEAKQQRTISNWDESLKANYKNTVVNYKKVPYNWLKKISNNFDSTNSVSTTMKRGRDGKLIKENGLLNEDQKILRSLWSLRDQLLESTTGIQRHSATINGDSLIFNGIDQ